MTQTVDRLKILHGNAAFPRGGTCRICGFSAKTLEALKAADPECVTFTTEPCFRFPDVCGLHSCRIEAKVCDCKACKKAKKSNQTNRLREWRKTPEGKKYKKRLRRAEAKAFLESDKCQVVSSD